MDDLNTALANCAKVWENQRISLEQQAAAELAQLQNANGRDERWAEGVRYRANQLVEQARGAEMHRLACQKGFALIDRTPVRLPESVKPVYTAAIVAGRGQYLTPKEASGLAASYKPPALKP